MKQDANGANQNRLHVYYALKDAIQYLELLPGSIIHEAELADRIGCSRTPIREALIQLSGEFLVDIFPQRGTYVSRIDFHLAHETAYMRHILDSDTCLSLCRQKAQITAIVERYLHFMACAVEKKDVVRYIRQDNAFHCAIFEYAGHEQVWSIISNSRAHYNRMLTLDLQCPGILEKSYQEHCHIISYIESGNVEALTALLDIHHDHRHNIDREQRIQTTFPEYFESII